MSFLQKSVIFNVKFQQIFEEVIFNVSLSKSDENLMRTFK